MLKETIRHVIFSPSQGFRTASSWNKNFNKAKFYLRKGDADNRAKYSRYDDAMVFPVTITLDLEKIETK